MSVRAGSTFVRSNRKVAWWADAAPQSHGASVGGLHPFLRKRGQADFNPVGSPQRWALAAAPGDPPDITDSHFPGGEGTELGACTSWSDRGSWISAPFQPFSLPTALWLPDPSVSSLMKGCWIHVCNGIKERTWNTVWQIVRVEKNDSYYSCIF